MVRFITTNRNDSAYNWRLHQGSLNKFRTLQMEITMKEKRNRTFSGWLVMAMGCFAFLFIVLLLAGSVHAAIPIAPAAAADATATPTPTQTSNTASSGALAVLTDGFDAWCAPQAYALKKPSGPDAPEYARILKKQGEKLVVPIPAAYCVLSFHLNQAVPDGTILTFYDAKSPFLRLPLTAAEGKTDIGWVMVRHTYVVNPPKWSVSYQLTVTGPDKQDLWSNKVSFVKPLPKMCPYGGYPNPVTMWCTPTDPWEIEPHPGVHYPYPRTPNP
jgi:hypothetical protein